MRSKHLIAAILLFLVAGAEAETLYRVSSTEMGIAQFDFTVTELSRKPKSSILEIPGFHDRSAAASRWMMCAYTDLAIKRGFSYWASIYPEPGSDRVLLVFPASEQPDDPAFEGMEIQPDELLVTAVGVFARFCGIQIN